ncbi:MAG TPA: uridine phosphorylase [Candidatus Gracilibacteria bacterium]|nr:uridine phosphorylase [Candidatus Gracilibacteria bacterium]
MPEHRNPYIQELVDDGEKDYLYHLGLDSGMDLPAMFGDVKFVCMGGSAKRAETFAKKLAHDLDLGIDPESLKPIGKTERGSLFKVGPILSLSHGMGMPSMSIFLHEVTKMLEHAGATDYRYIRIGTSGGVFRPDDEKGGTIGVGVEPGTVIVAEQAISEELQPIHKKVKLGKVHSYETWFDEEMAAEVLSVRGDIRAQIGKTMGANDFYEGQGRLDGALDPGYTEADKLEYLNQAYDVGVRNIEMEAPELAAFCNRAEIPAALVCATLLNRLEGDQVTSTPEQLAEFSENAQTLVVRYLRKKLNLSVADAI